MIQIYCDGLLLHDLRVKTLAVLNPVLTEEVNKTQAFTFSISPAHPYFNNMDKLKSIVEIYDDGEVIFEGRILSDKADIYKVKDVICEGALGYLYDSVQTPTTYTATTPTAYLTAKLVQHNANIDDNKKFVLGTVDITDTIDIVEKQYKKTLDVLIEQLVNVLGGYLTVRIVAGVKYLDYTSASGPVNTQSIEFSKNLLDLEQFIDSTDLITAGIFLGKALDGGGYTDITSVNSGSNFIYDAAAVALYGWIFGTKEWPDETDPTALKAKGQAWLNTVIELATTLTVTAVDLHIVDVDIEKIYIGDMVPCVSLYHGLNSNFQVAKKVTNFMNPEKNKLGMGSLIKGFIENKVAFDKNVNNLTNSFYNQVVSVEGLESDISEKLDIDQTTPQNMMGIFTLPVVSTPKIKPTADSTTAVGIFKADGTTNVLNIDTTNSRIGIGTTAPTAKLQVVTTDSATSWFINIAASSATAGAGLIGYSDDGAALASGDRMGFLLFGGASNNAHVLVNSVGLHGLTTEAWSATNQGGALAFLTTPNGSTTASRAERMRIDNNGNVGIGITSPTSKFQNVGNTAFTPIAKTVTNAGVALTVTNTNVEVTTDGNSNEDNGTLANGVTVGQIINIYVVAVGNAADSFKITPATMVGGTKVSFAASPLGKGCTMVWSASGWICTATNGGVVS